MKQIFITSLLLFSITTPASAAYVSPQDFFQAQLIAPEGEGDNFFTSDDMEWEEDVSDEWIDSVLEETAEQEEVQEPAQPAPSGTTRVFYRAGKRVEIGTSVRSNTQYTDDELSDYLEDTEDEWSDAEEEEAMDTIEDEEDTWSDYSGLLEETGWEEEQGVADSEGEEGGSDDEDADEDEKDEEHAAAPAQLDLLGGSGGGIMKLVMILAIGGGIGGGLLVLKKSKGAPKVAAAAPTQQPPAPQAGGPGANLGS